MSRFLFVVPPLEGHVNPTVAVAAELRARGHESAWVGHPGKVKPLLPEGARFFPLDERVDEAIWTSGVAKVAELRGLAAYKFLWEDFFVPLARSMLPGVEATIRAYDPHVVVADQQALAGGLAARKLGRPWATTATASATLVDPLASLPKVKEWFEGQLAALQREAGLEPLPGSDLSPRLVLAFTTRALLGDVPLPPQVRLVGPAFTGRAGSEPFPFEALAAKRRVLVSLGTVNAERGARFFAEVAEALGGMDVQVILVAPPALLPSPPANFLVRARVPQLRLLPEIQAVVCHGGQNTTCEALAHGLPLVIAPIKDDQSVIAEQVQTAGAGLRVRFGRVKAPELREAVRRVLDEPSFRDAAARIAASFAQAGGPIAAAEALLELTA